MIILLVCMAVLMIVVSKYPKERHIKFFLRIVAFVLMIVVTDDLWRINISSQEVNSEYGCYIDTKCRRGGCSVIFDQHGEITRFSIAQPNSFIREKMVAGS